MKYIKLVTYLRFFAPIFFVLCAVLRCYLETHVFAEDSIFSYYVVTHHGLWYLSAILGGMLCFHFVLGVGFKTLVWLFYSSFLLFVPILYAFYTGQSVLHLEYINPDIMNVLKTSVSGGYLSDHNRPVFPEMILIDSGSFFFAYFLKRNIKKAILTALSVHLVLILFGIGWFYADNRYIAIIKIITNLDKHIWLSMIWLFCTTVLVQVILIRSELQEKNEALITLISGLAMWSALVFVADIFFQGIPTFDLSMSLLPVFTVTAILTKHVFYKKIRVGDMIFLIQGSLFGLQLLITVPVLLNIH